MKVLSVFLTPSPSEKILVGKIAGDQERVFFQYAAEFLSRSIWLSPYKLPLQPEAIEHRDRAFGPIFGLFDDSLPDGWGLLLMDRFLRKKGIDPDDFSVLDRLSFLGHATMGALVYEPAMAHDAFDRLVDLQKMAEQSREVIRSESAEIIPELMRMGGSPQGARPKILVGVKQNRFISGADDLPDGYAHWLVKFPSLKNVRNAGRIEMAYSLMAGKAGIQMPETRLFEVASGEAYFGIKRFDRDGNNRYHVHSLGGLIHSNFRIPECDYKTFLRVVLDLTKHHQDVERGFRQMVFNIMAHNRDDHVKNFAFMIDANREWRLTPAYDLMYAPGPGGEHTMSVMGEGRAPGMDQVKALGRDCGLSPVRIRSIVDRVAGAVGQWEAVADETGVPETDMAFIREKLNRNRSRFVSCP